MTTSGTRSCAIPRTSFLPLMLQVRGSVLFNTAGGLVSFRSSELPFYLLPVMWFFNNVVSGCC